MNKKIASDNRSAAITALVIGVILTGNGIELFVKDWFLKG
jgi:hypothetical protein